MKDHEPQTAPSLLARTPESKDGPAEREYGITQVLKGLKPRYEALRQQVDREIQDLQRRAFLQIRNSRKVEDRIHAACCFPWASYRDLIPKLFADPEPRVRAAFFNNWMAKSHFPEEYERLYRDPDPSVRRTLAESHFLTLARRPDLVRSYLADNDLSVQLAVAKNWSPTFGSRELVVDLVVREHDNPALLKIVQKNPHLRSIHKEVTGSAEPQRSGSSPV